MNKPFNNRTTRPRENGQQEDDTGPYKKQRLNGNLMDDIGASALVEIYKST